MAVNKQHPDFPEYKRKWDELCAQMDDELSKVLPPLRPGRDGEDGVIYKTFAKKLKALQDEYEYLYE